MKVAFTGKGGVGKTTLASLFVRVLSKGNKEVLAVDCDPDSNLARTLGFKDADNITPIVHMKDMIIHDGSQMFAPVGEGNLNWPAILKACKKADVKYHIVEQDRCLRDPFDCIASSLKNMKSWGLS